MEIPHIALYVFHVLVVAPFFLYVAFKRNEVPDVVFTVMGVLAVVILGYHSWRAYMRGGGAAAWVNWIHIALVVPLLAYIALTKKETPRRMYELLALLGFSALGYHATYLVKDLVGGGNDH
jgi:hypothetical protein